jgi:hypothetical protein
VRTTLSLDDDVARLVNQESRRSGASFKEVINRLLRLGLMASRRQTCKPFVVAPRKMGLPPGASYDDVEQLIEAVEGSSHL